MRPKPEDRKRRPAPLASANSRNSSISGSETGSESGNEDSPSYILPVIPENAAKQKISESTDHGPEPDATSGHDPQVSPNLEDRTEGEDTLSQSIGSFEYMPQTPGSGYPGRAESNYSASVASTINNGDWRRRSIRRASSTIGSFTTDYEKQSYERPTKAWLARNEGKNEEFQRRMTEEELKKKSRLSAALKTPISAPRTPVRSNSRASPGSMESSRFSFGWASQSRIPRTPNFTGRRKESGYFDSEHGGSPYQELDRTPPAHLDHEIQAMKEIAKGAFQNCIWMNTELQAISQRNRKSEGKTHQKIISMQARLRDIITGRDDKETAKRTMEEVKESTRDVEEDLRRLKNDLEQVQKAHMKLEEELRMEKFNRQLAGKRVEELTSEKESRAREMASLERKLEELRASQETGNAPTAEMLKLQQQLAAAKQAMSQNSREITAYTDILLDSEKTDLVMLRVRTGELVDEYAAKLSDVEKDMVSLKLELAQKEQEFHDQEKHYQAEIESLKSAANSPITPSSTQFSGEDSKGRDHLAKIIKDKTAAYQKLHEEFKKLRAIQIRYDGPKLKQQNEDLKNRLTTMTDRYNLSVQETKRWKEKAANWQHEHESVQERYQQSSNEYEERLRHVQDEMAQIIKEYQDHLPDKDPKWWDINDLQKAVRKRESELSDRANENHRLRAERDQAIEKFHEARAAMEQGNTIRYIDNPSDIKPTAVRIPRYETEEEIRKRNHAIEGFKKAQKKSREALTAREKLIEDARQYKMGSMYPPDQPGYPLLASKDAYKRWDVKAFKRDRDEAARYVAEAAN